MIEKDHARLTVELRFSIEEGLRFYLQQTRCEYKSPSLVCTQKAAVDPIDGGFPVNRSLLRHSQRFQRWLIDRCCFCQAVGALVIRNSGARLRAKQTIHVTGLKPCSLQCGLDICDH